MFFCVLNNVERHLAGVLRHFWLGRHASASVFLNYCPRNTTWVPASAGKTVSCGLARRITPGAPCKSPSSGANAGVVREDCLRASTNSTTRATKSTSPSSAAARVCEQRREPEGRRTWGRLFFGYFLLAKQKKVSCRRATPGIAALAIALVLTACGTTPKKTEPPKQSSTSTAKPGAYYLDDGPGENPPPNLDAIPNAVPKTEKLHSGANRTYTVFGKTYVPNVSNEPFRQQGLASWYGRKFHGQKTSIGETYDMYAMTAAHPTLPLPCYVHVTNPANGKSVVVRVNDRGPFHSDRIIDLSYTAAAKLDVARRGSAMVIVERVFAGGRDQTSTASIAAPLAPQPIATAVAVSPVIPEAGGLYLQLGAFGSMENAEIFRARLVRELDWNREPIQISRKDNLYRVRMGPYNSREEADAIVAQVRRSHDFSPVIQQP